MALDVTVTSCMCLYRLYRTTLAVDCRQLHLHTLLTAQHDCSDAVLRYLSYMGASAYKMAIHDSLLDCWRAPAHTACTTMYCCSECLSSSVPIEGAPLLCRLWRAAHRLFMRVL